MNKIGWFDAIPDCENYSGNNSSKDVMCQLVPIPKGWAGAIYNGGNYEKII